MARKGGIDKSRIDPLHYEFHKRNEFSECTGTDKETGCKKDLKVRTERTSGHIQNTNLNPFLATGSIKKDLKQRLIKYKPATQLLYLFPGTVWKKTASLFSAYPG